MAAAASVIFSVGGLVVVGFVLRATLPGSPVFPVRWNAQEFYIPLNIAAFWVSIAAAVLVGTVQIIRAMLRGAERLR